MQIELSVVKKKIDKIKKIKIYRLNETLWTWSGYQYVLTTH